MSFCLQIMAENIETGGDAPLELENPTETDEEPSLPVERTEDFQKLIDYGLNEKVAIKLDEIYQQGKLKHEVRTLLFLNVD